MPLFQGLKRKTHGSGRLIHDDSWTLARVSGNYLPMSPQEMKTRLETAYPDGTIDVIDTTGTSDHFEVYVETSRFQGLSRIDQHKNVMSIFDLELKSGEVHALSIRTKVKG